MAITSCLRRVLNDTDERPARVSACWSSSPGVSVALVGGVATETQAPTTAAHDGGSGAATDWYPKGQTMQFATPRTGEQASWEVKGTVEMENRRPCKIVWEPNQGEVRRIEMYFSEEERYQRTLTYDADGRVVNEVVQRSSDSP